MWAWDTRYLVGLNGSNASSLGERYARVLTLSQATPANQPLYTGAASFNGWPSLQFTTASVHKLFRASTDVMGGGAYTLICVRKLSAGDAVPMANANAFSTGALYREQPAGTLLQTFGGTRTFAVGSIAADRTAVHVVAINSDGVEWVDNVSQTLTPSGSLGPTPGAGAELSIGYSQSPSLAPTMNFLFAAWVQGLLPASAVRRVSKGLGAAAGIRMAG